MNRSRNGTHLNCIHLKLYFWAETSCALDSHFPSSLIFLESFSYVDFPFLVIFFFFIICKIKTRFHWLNNLYYHAISLWKALSQADLLYMSFELTLKRSPWMHLWEKKQHTDDNESTFLAYTTQLVCTFQPTLL